MRLYRYFNNLPIRYKILFGFILAFIFTAILEGVIINGFVKRIIEAHIESELKNTTAMILNMVKTAADVSIKNHLRAVAEKNREITEGFYRQFEHGDFSEEEAKSRAADVLLSQRIGKTGYIYCVDSTGTILIHPRPALIRADLSAYDFIRTQMAEKEGYIEYDWKNPGEDHARPKALYMTYFEPWDWIISVSSYRSEFNDLIHVRDFKDSILNLSFGKTGYSYIMDSSGNLIVHPKASGNILESAEPESREHIREILKQKTGKMSYAWKNVGEKAPREKLVIFNYIPEVDWVVASSSYLDEFYAPLAVIRNIIFFTVTICLMLMLPFLLKISTSITRPLGQLMNAFSRGAAGDISVRVDQHTHDEAGQLARYFNKFMSELERMGAYVQNIVDFMPSVLVGVDQKGQVTQWNREARVVTEISKEMALGKKLVDIFPLLTPYMELVYGAMDDNTTKHLEKVSSRQNREQRLWDIVIYPVRSEETQSAVIRLDDVTERVRIEEIMVQTEKMMSVGGLAAGMAHEINNPLGGILQSVQNIYRRLSAELPVNRQAALESGTDLFKIRAYLEKRNIFKMLDGIKDAGERATKIVSNMLSFSRRSKFNPMPTRLADLLDKTIALAAHDYDLKKTYDFKNVEIIRNFSDVPDVSCDPVQIEQVVLNLLSNAAYEMKPGEASQHPPKIFLSLYRKDDMAVMEVKDNGPGMAEDIKKRVFEPFFTTKSVGVGTGLGLSVSYFIITQNHKGLISVDSEPGKGTTFIIQLPINPEKSNGKKYGP